MSGLEWDRFSWRRGVLTLHRWDLSRFDLKIAHKGVWAVLLLALKRLFFL